jgi:predicted nucleic acid-binding protein
VTAADAVLDASVFVRAAVRRDDEARRIVDSVEAEELDAHVPELVFAEVAHALLRYVRASRMTADEAVAVAETVSALPLRSYRLSALAPAALALALDRGLSAYDRFYAVLAESTDVPLVTADRRLAAAVPNAKLIA